MARSMQVVLPALAVALVVALTAHNAAAAFVPAPRWGGNNDTLAWTALVNMTDQHTDPQQPNWQFKYWYDSTIPASRYDHGPGNSDEVCAGNGQTQGNPCTVLNADDGHLYLEYPTTGCVSLHRCCVYPVPVRCTCAVGWMGKGSGGCSDPVLT